MMPSIARQPLNRRFGKIFLLMALLIPAARSSALVIKASAWPESLTVGDRFLYVNVVELQPGMEVEPVTPDQNFGDATVLSAPYRLEKSSANTVAYACTLAVYQPGPARIPTLAFRSANSADTTTYTGDSLSLNIGSVLPADTAGLQIADIKGPRRLREPLWPYFVIVLGVLCLIFAGGYLYRRFTGKIETPALPSTPPWEIALQRLDVLKGERHIDFGRFKQYYFELSMIIRGYLEGRYNTLAVERTTYELEDDPGLKTDLPQNLYENLFDFFDRSDLIKFAKSIPTSENAESDLAFAYDFVVQTKPLPVAEPVVEKAAPQEVKD
jgi:hypothetical protein